MNDDELSAKIRATIEAQVASDVERTGLHVTAVGPTADSAVNTYFAYTVGLWGKQQHPELIVFGLRPRVAHAVFTTVYERVVAGARFTPGQIVTDLVQGDFPILFVAAPNSDPDYPTSTATGYYGHRDYAVLQLVLSDAQKRFPWDPSCDKHMALTQQLLGPLVEP